MPHPKRRAVASVPDPCVARPNGEDDNDNAFSESMSDEVASVLFPCAAPPNNNNNNEDNNAFSKSVLDEASTHIANGLVIDIVGIAAADRGYQCREHKVCCGKVVNVDKVVHL